MTAGDGLVPPIVEGLFAPSEIVGIGPLDPNAMDGPTRGRYVRTLDQAEIDAEAARLRSEGRSYREIAETMGCNVKTAHDRVRRALAAVPAEAVGEMRTIWGLQLTEAIRVAWREMHRDHVMVSHGKIVKDNGVPLIDHGAKLTAVAAFIRACESYRKLMGADIPVKAELAVTVEHTTTLDEEIATLLSRMGESVTDDADAPG